MSAKDTKEKEAALPEGQAEKPKKKSRAKKLVIILALLIMIFGGCGAVAYWWFFLRSPAVDSVEVNESIALQGDSSSSGTQGSSADGSDLAKAKIERQSDLPRSGGIVLPLPAITVNLQDPNGRRYLKLGMEVEVNSDVSAQLRANTSRIRDAIIMLLAGKTYGDVATPDGKVLLKAEIAARLNQILGAQRVVRVYFTDFVVE